MNTQTQNAFNPFQTASEAFQTTMETGLKFQKDAVDMFGNASDRGTGMEDFRTRFQDFANESIEVIRDNAEQSGKLFEQSCRSSADLVQKNMDRIGKDDSNGKDFFAQAQHSFQDTFDAMRNTSDAFAKTNTRMLENFSKFVNQTMSTPVKKAATVTK